MRVDVSPRSSVAEPGRPVPITVLVTNTGDLIGGYTLRVLGADPSWVQLDTDQLSLFPGTSQTVQVNVAVPEGIAAGERRIAIQVRELTPPYANAVEEIELQVPAAPAVHLQLDPVTVYGGRRASFGAVIENKGNTTVIGRLAGGDAEDKIRFGFAPAAVRLAPGEHRIVELTTRARRPLAGSPLVRVFTVHLDESVESALPLVTVDPADPAIPPDLPPLATGTFLQRPWLSRGPISLLGLLAAVTVFAVVITVALARLVGQSAADRDLALQVAQARTAGSVTGTAAMSGTVRLLTSGTPVPGVAVEAFSTADVANAIATTATNSAGTFRLPNLPEGSYKLRFRGAGFVQLWYPGAATDADASTVTISPGQNRQGLDVRLGGVPATISGTVSGDDVSGASVYLELPGAGTGTVGTAKAATPSASAAPGTTEAIVRTVPVGSDGQFSIAQVPSPSVYDLVVTKPGYANDVQRVDLGGGEDRKGVQLRLRKGDGLISGQVNSPSGALGGATVTATSGSTVARTVSLTQDKVGSFTLISLPTPASFTVVVSKPGYASQTVTIALSAGQKLTGVSVSLGQSAGSLSGKVSVLPGGLPAQGVTVTVTNGALTVQTVTQSTGDVGRWTVGGLTVPSTYTVTFSRPDLAGQTVSVSLDQAGTITPGSQGAVITSDGISVGMQSSTAVVRGTVSQRGAANDEGGPVRTGEVQINLVSGTSSFAVTSASKPDNRLGQFEIDGVPPGTYTLSVNRRGTSPTSTIITLAAGEVRTYNPVLAAPAQISGVVRTVGGQLRPGWVVQLYLASQYPTVIARTVTTDSSGRYVLPDVDAPQSYVIEARPTASGAAQGSVTRQINASEQLTADITVPNPGG
ncbi:carboxypeptidase regulatory-like domain-containing protein [Jatrophihabitans sp.]|uniref:carboxypeptidase regulatory-like domain-containing protein n=1 Tax=Jatrophihabitans sp. TaxID=1932789 RepID=UPI002C91D902|nr:carboxypeptidase regulatory-like domain-containing protein [Jatrophihabitans sp.]